ncbi:acyltransferase [Demequina globuliformis]|uniref:acyltransferase n=1 Tax=Demequina globuliformis TaxID=676202 RepID=UPI000782E31B|nr:acyltransferase [Demequina globuliformis]
MTALQQARRAWTQLWTDPGEKRPIIWHWVVNGVLASTCVPARLRTVGYRMMGLHLHRSVLVRPGASIRDRHLTVGAHSTINGKCVFDNRTDVEVGARVGIGIGAMFITTDHVRANPRQRSGTGKSAPITVRDGASIGSGAIILSGVTIGEGAVVAAGALVNRDCEPHGLYAGTPARRVKDLPTDDAS